jgi:phage baseplate assembly protein V
MSAFRAVLNALGLGRVTLINDSGPAQVAQVRGNELELRHIPVAGLYGLASHPLPGADVVVVYLGGDRGKGVVIATADRRYRLRNLAPGETALYTDEGDVVKLSRGRVVEVVAGTELRITAPLVTISGDLRVVGDITDQDGAHGTLGALRTAYDAHRHPGVEPGGGSTDVTDQPV